MASRVIGDRPTETGGNHHLHGGLRILSPLKIPGSVRSTIR
jgi:hypothetical protein